MEAPEVPSPGKTWPVIVAVAINLIPIVGVIFWGWSAFALIALYWLENIVIGVRNVLSMLASGALGGLAGIPGAIFFSAFFTVHYGMFCFGHGIFVMAMFGGVDGEGFQGDSILDLAGAVRELMATQANLFIGFASIVLWQLVQFILFLVRGEAARTNPLDLMSAPYARIIVLHLTIIFGGFILLGLNQPVGGVVILALVKMAYDVAEVSGRAPKFSFDRRRRSDDTERLAP
jgi:hypothetical protein